MKDFKRESVVERMFDIFFNVSLSSELFAKEMNVGFLDVSDNFKKRSVSQNHRIAPKYQKLILHFLHLNAFSQLFVILLFLCLSGMYCDAAIPF